MEQDCNCPCEAVGHYVPYLQSEDIYRLKGNITALQMERCILGELEAGAKRGDSKGHYPHFTRPQKATQ